VAKPLVFKFSGSDAGGSDVGGSELAFHLHKIDRSKLYGYKELEVLDQQGRGCELATLAGDGHTVVGRGGAALATLDADGRWCEKSQLKPIDLDGKEIAPVASSYAAPIESLQPCPADEYLQHNIRLVYQLEAEPSPQPSPISGEGALSLRDELNKGTIFKFPYSYRGGLEADAGFLLSGEDGNIFFAVGNPTKVEYIGLAQVAIAEDENPETEEMDLMDFDMI
jgi:hypothetical protein